MLPALGTAVFIGLVTGVGGVVTYTAFKAANIGKEEETMAIPRTEAERQAYHERVYGKGATPPGERLGRGQAVNDLLPMSPNRGLPLPRFLNLKWPWIKD